MILSKGRSSSNSHYENDFGVSSAFAAENTKIVFLKARRRRAFKKRMATAIEQERSYG
ncbi:MULTISPECIES: hypothetical protein [Pseudanabaena]|jgi:hypothetical protein|uniref:hypothetical protein n=1 Tax=Pseudanabaena TaxID=1152 RepID=UPI002479C51F|nr:MULTISPECIES: hypothetical protein [Pseudanabaena]MEA5488677.1 hypothetical protein [Pseudanabaena sp. CCNP1317]WGS72144.1 hypothetical protein OA858_20930 [Pseudanabaena galeata CCNP1313]